MIQETETAIGIEIEIEEEEEVPRLLIIGREDARIPLIEKKGNMINMKGAIKEIIIQKI